jgi:hypothetical protein
MSTNQGKMTTKLIGVAVSLTGVLLCACSQDDYERHRALDRVFAAEKELDRARHEVVGIDIAHVTRTLPPDKVKDYYWSVLQAWDRKDGGSRVATCIGFWNDPSMAAIRASSEKDPDEAWVAQCIMDSPLPANAT